MGDNVTSRAMFGDQSLKFELAALAAAACWSVTGMISVIPAGHLGAIAFNRVRQSIVTVMLAVYVVATGTWEHLTWGNTLPLILSGFIGIFIGDSLLFGALNRLGPRRTGILFSLNAPIAVVLGWLILSETLPLQALLGMGLIVAGVILAIIFGKGRNQTHSWESVKGPLWIGVALGLGAAAGQAVGSIIARPVMATGIDPFAASMLRMGVAAFCLNILVQLPIESVKPLRPLTWKILLLTALTGVIAMGMGMTFLMFALSGGKVGVISTLSSTYPVITLPMLWFKTGERPAAGAWMGAVLVVAGTALMFMGPG
jgi:drug/metabolite transporter (DMT)-like permease